MCTRTCTHAVHVLWNSNNNRLNRDHLSSVGSGSDELQPCRTGWDSGSDSLTPGVDCKTCRRPCVLNKPWACRAEFDFNIDLWSSQCAYQPPWGRHRANDYHNEVRGQHTRIIHYQHTRIIHYQDLQMPRSPTGQ